jgi:hypothetical protein
MTSRWLSDENAHNLSNISASFLTWTIVYLVIYSRKTSDRIKQMSPNAIRLKRHELGVKIASIIHATYTSYGAYKCLQEQEFSDFNFFNRSEAASYYANVAAGFFIADFILCVILIEEHGVEFLIHAIAALGGSLSVSLTGIGHQYFLHLLLFEASTPFLYFRSLLLEYGYGKTKVALFNNLVFLLTFGYFRLFRGIPIIAHMCYNLIVQKPLSIPVTGFFVVSGIAMSILNVRWFIKILRSGLKAFNSLND